MCIIDYFHGNTTEYARHIRKSIDEIWFDCEKACTPERGLIKLTSHSRIVWRQDPPREIPRFQPRRRCTMRAQHGKPLHVEKIELTKVPRHAFNTSPSTRRRSFNSIVPGKRNESLQSCPCYARDNPLSVRHPRLLTLVRLAALSPTNRSPSWHTYSPILTENLEATGSSE